VSRRGRKRARLWFDIHSWVGLKLSIFMSFILVTGTLAVLSAEMDWATHASMRVEPRPESERASWGALYTAARAAYPDWQIGYLTEPVDPWFAAQAYGYTPAGHTRLIDIDPYSAEVRGDRAVAFLVSRHWPVDLRSLPARLRPRELHRVDALPHNERGKLDRQSLRSLAAELAGARRGSTLDERPAAQRTSVDGELVANISAS